MSLCSSGCGDFESVLDSGEGGGGLTLIDSGIPHPISVAAYPESDDDSLDARL